jgi:hypothetical protein
MFWQLTVVAIVVGLATASLIRRVARLIRGDRGLGCGSCGSCASAGSSDFVSLDSLRPVPSSLPSESGQPGNRAGV